MWTPWDGDAWHWCCFSISPLLIIPVWNLHPLEYAYAGLTDGGKKRKEMIIKFHRYNQPKQKRKGSRWTMEKKKIYLNWFSLWETARHTWTCDGSESCRVYFCFTGCCMRLQSDLTAISRSNIPNKLTNPWQGNESASYVCVCVCVCVYVCVCV